MSQKSREATSKNSTERITEKRTDWGLKEYSKGEKYRSSYEYGFAVYLKELGIKFEYEKFGEPIELLSGVMLHYIPDFYLPEYGVYIEIVNHMDRRLQNKMYYYQEQNRLGKLLVFDKKTLRSLFDSKFNIYDIIGYKKHK